MAWMSPGFDSPRVHTSLLVSLLSMKNSGYILNSFVHAASVVLYVSAVSWLLFNAETMFKEPPELLAPVLMLLLFIVSATVTGLLVLGKPLSLYLDGFKKDALVLLLSTLGWLVLFLIAVAAVSLVA